MATRCAARLLGAIARLLGVASIAAMMGVSPAPAEDAKPPVTLTAESQAQAERKIKTEIGRPVEAKPKLKEDPIEAVKKFLGLSLYAQASYLYNPESSHNDYHLFDYNADRFTWDMFEVLLNHDAALGGLGGRFKFTLGETGRYLHANGLGTTTGRDPTTTSPADFTEFYAEYNAPLGSGLHIVFGKWVSLMGSEVLEAVDDVNLSRSFLYNCAVPFTHTGLRTSYTLADRITLGFQLVRGWDQFGDCNSSPTLGFTLGLSPSEKISLNTNFMTGPEQSGDSENIRNLLDLVLTVKPIKSIAIAMNTDVGWEQNVPDIGNATWKGISTTAQWSPKDWFAFGIRGEWFQDTNGARTGVAQDLKEITITLDFKYKGFVLRPEYRHDWSNVASFDDDTRYSQDIIGFGLMYRW